MAVRGPAAAAKTFLPAAKTKTGSRYLARSRASRHAGTWSRRSATGSRRSTRSPHKFKMPAPPFASCAKAKDHNIDRDKFAAVGFSAGGHLALLLGMADKVDGWDIGDNTEESARVQCVVDYFGPTDLSLYNTAAIEDAYLVPVFGKAAKTDKEIYKRASPISYVAKSSPPVLLMHGTFDVVVPVIHSESLHKKLKDAGATSELITLFGEGHGWTGRTSTKTTNETLKFLDTHLKGKK